MLKTKVIRLLGLGAPADLWRQAGAVHPLGEHFNALVDLVPHQSTAGRWRRSSPPSGCRDDRGSPALGYPRTGDGQARGLG